MLKDFQQSLRSGHWPTLLGAWLHFEISFMVWLLIGALSIAISDDFGLSASQKGLLVGVPLLGGALLRIVVGPLGDWVGGKIVGLGILGLELVGLVLGWQWATQFEHMLVVGALLGVAGASFAIVLPLASQAYPSAHQGLAMGMVAIGNSGVVLASLIAPRLAVMLGWHQVFAVMVVPVLFAAVIFLKLVRATGRQHDNAETWRLQNSFELLIQGLQEKYMHWLSGLYVVTFGGFVGLSSYLPIFFHDRFQVDMVTAGTLTAIIALVGSLARPIGGFVADRASGLMLMQWVCILVFILCLVAGQLSNAAWFFGVIILTVSCLGFGSGVIFQIVSYRFQHIMGTASGLIGAAGGIGGFLLPTCFGWLQDTTGTFSIGFLLFGLISAMAAFSVMMVQRSLRFTIPKSV